MHYTKDSKFLGVCQHLYQMQMKISKKFRNSHTLIITHAVTEVINKFNNVKMQREDTQTTSFCLNVTRKMFYNEN